jgi:hypothetical protein
MVAHVIRGGVQKVRLQSERDAEALRHGQTLESAHILDIAGSVADGAVNHRIEGNPVIHL